MNPAAARFGLRGMLGRLWADKPAFLAVVYLVVLILAAVFGPLLLSASPAQTDLLARFQPPFESGEHVLGTDSLGRDMLARLLAGARLSLLIGFSVVIIAGAVGTLLGLIAGYKGGRVESVIMRVADAQLAFPGLLVVLLVLAFLGASVTTVIGILAVYGWMVYARLVRGQVLQLRQTPAIQSAELLGCSTRRILFRHLLPNLYPIILTQAMLEFARVVLTEASLSYLGLGVQPPDTSWGLMVAENQAYLGQAWWTVVLPGLALTCTVVALNLAANWLGVQTDPTQRSRQFALGALRSRRPKLDRAESVPAGSLLAVEDLRVAFHTEAGVVSAVDEVSLDIAPGETVGIVGESGSGKSTTALALMDLVPPPGRIEHAAIAWEGKPLRSWKELRALRGSDVTMIFQDPMTSLNPLVPIGRQISESLTVHRGMNRGAAQARAEELLEMVGVPSPRERLKQFPHELSGGLRQRVMIAIALAPEPKLVIADEPTTALDATIQSQILELIADLQRQLGIAMILITHDLGVVARVCDRVLVMYGGRLVEWADAGALFRGPRHRYTEALLAAAPTIDYEGERLPTIPGTPPRGTAADPGCPFVPRCAHASERCGETPAPALAGDGHGFSCWNPADEPRLLAREVGAR